MNFDFALSFLCFCSFTHCRAFAVHAKSNGSAQQNYAGVKLLNRSLSSQPSRYEVFDATQLTVSPFMSLNMLGNLKRYMQAYISIPEQVETVQFLQQHPKQYGQTDENFDPRSHALYAFFSACVFACLVVIVGFFYDKEKKFPPDVDEGTVLTPDSFKKGEFHHGLFSCFDDMGLCLLSCCCSPIRWADTMRMMDFLPFWAALFIYLGCMVLDTVMVGLAGLVLLGICTYYRQKIRSKFEMPSGSCGSVCLDCCTYLFCSCCAIVQEARQVEDAFKAKALPIPV